MTTSPAATPSSASDARDLARASEEDRILDAALELFGDVGVRRATIGDVAKRAGIDRVTVYRRVGGKDDVVAAVVAREAGRLFSEVLEEANEQPTLEERVIVGFATLIERVRAHGMLARMLDLEPDTLLLRLTRDGGPVLVAAISVVMNLFETARADGLVDTVEDLGPVAEVVVRVAHSFLLTPRAVADVESREDLVAFARQTLLPLVKSGTAPVEL